MKQFVTAAVGGCLFAGMVCFAACDKHSDHDDDPMQPVIVLSTPANNQVYNNGDSVIIQGNVTDNSLHELRIRIRSGSTELFSEEISIHNFTSYDFREGWKAVVAAATDAEVKVEAEDHGNHVVEKTVNIHINP